ncbi:MAG: hypothetical protein HYZ27_01020 [Deltaproteobacteria bacterium]|nr:hypothetical protein [Deltaproteobacteria bacterium]
MTLPVTANKPPPESAVAHEAGAWRDTFAAKFTQAVEAGLTPTKALALCTHELLAPTAGDVSLRDLPLQTAQEMVAARGKAMQEFLASWAKSIRKNAKADDKAHQRRLLLANEVDRFGPAALRRAGLRLNSRVSKLPAQPVDIALALAPAPDRARVVPPLAAAFDANSDSASVNLRKPLV